MRDGTRAVLGSIVAFGLIAVSGAIARLTFLCLAHFYPALDVRLPRGAISLFVMVSVFSSLYGLINARLRASGSKHNGYTWLVEVVGKALGAR